MIWPAPDWHEGGRERRRVTFDNIADSYHQARPDYPAELYDELVSAAGLSPGDRLLEIGCATGKATLPLAARGFRLTCLELGHELAAAARRNLAGLDAEVIDSSFESWQPTSGSAGFDLVFAATAWHWIDPEVRYRKAWQLLRPGGHLAIYDIIHTAEYAKVFKDLGLANIKLSGYSFLWCIPSRTITATKTSA